MNNYLFFPKWKQIQNSLLATLVILISAIVMLMIGRKVLGEGVISLVFLLVTGWSTLRWGRVPGASAALTSGLCFDFLFIPPYFSFTVGNFEGWLVLLIFLVVAVFVVGRLQVILNDSQGRERDAVVLYEMVTSIANLNSREEIAKTVAERIKDQYLAEKVQVNLYSYDENIPVTYNSSNESTKLTTRIPDRILPIPSFTRIVGEISFWKGKLDLPLDGSYMLQSFLRQTAMALERVQEIKTNN
jgi:K+-sensing histidine kinase KdpD